MVLDGGQSFHDVDDQAGYLDQDRCLRVAVPGDELAEARVAHAVGVDVEVGELPGREPVKLRSRPMASMAGVSLASRSARQSGWLLRQPRVARAESSWTCLRAWEIDDLATGREGIQHGGGKTFQVVPKLRPVLSVVPGQPVMPFFAGPTHSRPATAGRSCCHHAATKIKKA